MKRSVVLLHGNKGMASSSLSSLSGTNGSVKQRHGSASTANTANTTSTTSGSGSGGTNHKKENTVIGNTSFQETIKYLTSKNKASSVLLGTDFDFQYKNRKKHNKPAVETLVSKMNEILPNIDSLKRSTVDLHYNSIVDILNMTTVSATATATPTATTTTTTPSSVSSSTSSPRKQVGGFNRFIKYFVAGSGEQRSMSIHEISKLLNENTSVEDYHKIVKTVRYFVSNDLVGPVQEKLQDEIVIYCYYMIYKKGGCNSRDDLGVLLELNDRLFTTQKGGEQFLKLNNHIKRLLLVLNKNVIFRSAESGARGIPGMLLERICSLLERVSRGSGVHSSEELVRFVVLLFQVFGHDAKRLRAKLDEYIAVYDGDVDVDVDGTAWTREQVLYVDTLELLDMVRSAVVAGELHGSQAEVAKINHCVKQITSSCIQNKILYGKVANFERFYFDVGKALRTLHVVQEKPVLSEPHSHAVQIITHRLEETMTKIKDTVEKHKVDLILGVI